MTLSHLAGRCDFYPSQPLRLSGLVGHVDFSTVIRVGLHRRLEDWICCGLGTNTIVAGFIP
jgi:hypothetical protein